MEGMRVMLVRRSKCKDRKGAGKRYGSLWLIYFLWVLLMALCSFGFSLWILSFDVDLVKRDSEGCFPIDPGV